VAMAELKITIYFDVELDLKVEKDLPRGCTIGELKAELASEDPTGQARPEDFVLVPATKVHGRALGDNEELGDSLTELVVRTAGGDDEEEEPPAPEPAALAPPSASPTAASVALNSPDGAGAECREYRVVQGPLFKKPGKDPTTSKIVKLKKKVGAKIKTTGKTWSGPAGGKWVELDVTEEAKSTPGWVLIQGQGQPNKQTNSVGITGPMLLEGSMPPAFIVRAAKPVVFASSNPEDIEHSEFLLHPSMKVGVLKLIIGGLFDLHADQMIVSKPCGPATQTAGNIDVTTAEQLLEDHVIVGEVFKEGDEVPFIYKGRLPDTYYPMAGGL